MGWALDSAQARQLLTLGSIAFDNDEATRAVVFAQQYRYRGDSVRMRAYADTARMAFEANLRKAPNDQQQHLFLGLMLAYLGDRTNAVREGERGVALESSAGDPSGGYYQHQVARIDMATGQFDKALDIIESLVRQKYLLSPGWLRIDPNFAPLRGNPRFEKLIASTPAS